MEEGIIEHFLYLKAPWNCLKILHRNVHSLINIYYGKTTIKKNTKTLLSISLKNSVCDKFIFELRLNRMLGEQEMSLRTLNNAIIRASIVLVCGSLLGARLHKANLQLVVCFCANTSSSSIHVMYDHIREVSMGTCYQYLPVI